MSKTSSSIIVILFFFSLTLGLSQDSNTISCMIDINDDHTYSLTVDSIKVEPIVGQHNFLMGFYKTLRYPPSARNNGVQGTVILEVFVDKNGIVEKTEIIQSLHKECDEASEKAFWENIQSGFHPLVINEEAKSFKFQLPVKFRLE